jgi:shikimate dehydrogenase
MPEQRLPIIGSTTEPGLPEVVLVAGLTALGVEVEVERWTPRPHLLGESISKLRAKSYLGALIVAPHKEKASGLTNGLSDDARVSGAVNVIARDGARLRGHNTDVDGIRAGLASILPRIQGKWPRNAVVLGAGGGARAAVTVLIGSGFQRVAVFNRHLHKAEALVAHFSRSARHMELRARPWHETILEAEVSRAGLVIDASGLGADEAASALSPEALPDDLYVLDLALQESTGLMRDARIRGGKAANGQLSLVTAMGTALRIWTGSEPPADALRSALASALEQDRGDSSASIDLAGA